MPPEITNHSISDMGPARANPDAILSESLFANPKDFLTTLQSVWPTINEANPYDVSRSDLIAYTYDGESAKGRAAAALALSHFDQLKDMSKVLTDRIEDPVPSGLSQEEVDADLALETGGAKTLVFKNLSNDCQDAAVNGLFATGTGALMLAALEAPPAAIAFGAMTAGLGYEVGRAAIHAAMLPHNTETAAALEQKTLANWPEFHKH